MVCVLYFTMIYLQAAVGSQMSLMKVETLGQTVSFSILIAFSFLLRRTFLFATKVPLVYYWLRTHLHLLAQRDLTNLPSQKRSRLYFFMH
jgi:hypothetical protein